MRQTKMGEDTNVPRPLHFLLVARFVALFVD